MKTFLLKRVIPFIIAAMLCILPAGSVIAAENDVIDPSLQTGTGAVSEIEESPTEETDTEETGITEPDTEETEITVSEEEEAVISELSILESVQTDEPSGPEILHKGFNGTYTEYKTILRGVNVSEGDIISAAVWSKANGQDDLKWNTVEVKADGTAEAVVRIPDYKDPGTFYIHFYRISSDHRYDFLFSDEFEVPLLRSAEVKIRDIDKNSGRAVIEITGIDSPAGVKNVKAASWSRSDQSDLIWKNADHEGNGVYSLTLNIAEHGNNSGCYYTHVYIEDLNGFVRFAGGAGPDFRMKVSGPEVEYDEGTAVCRVTLTADSFPKSISGVEMAIWSEENGQDDLKWIPMSLDAGSGSISAEFNTGFLKHRGNICIHAYAVDAKGNKTFLAGGGFKTEEASIEAITVTEDVSGGIFKVTEVNVKNLLASEALQAAVWSRADQSDLVWYDLKRNGNDHEVTVNIKDHKYNTGKYQIHVYKSSSNGYKKYMNGASAEMKVSSGAVEAEDKNTGVPGREQTEYTVRVNGIIVPAGMTSLRCAVWNEKKGTSNLRWYDLNLKNNGDGTYSGTFELNIANHEEAGKYIMHFYGKTRTGHDVFITGYDGLVIDAENTAMKLSMFDKKNSDGTFKVKAEILRGISGVSKVSIAVWTEEGGQDDLKWYTAEKQADGSYQAVIRVSDHKYSFGLYNVHAYVTSGNGQFKMAGGIAENPEASDKSVMKTSTPGEREIRLYNGIPASGTVSVAVWSDQNGQDDLVWYDLIRDNKGAYAVFRASNHLNSGKYTGHIYANGQFLDGVQFEIPYSETKTAYTEIAAAVKAAKTEKQLILVDTSGTSAQIVMLNKNSDGSWFQILSTPGYIGRGGMGETTEWNGRTPQGIYGFTKAFGIMGDPGTAFDYIKVDYSHYWVDDVYSMYYNKMVSTHDTWPDWSSAEHLIDYTNSYRYCLAIDYNPECIPGVGSAIFLHCSDGRATGGCVSVPEIYMIKILNCIRTDCKIIIDSNSGFYSY